MDFILKLALGQEINDKDIEYELYEICDRVHSSCDSECPVYFLNGNEVPDTAKDFEVNRGCDCFKSGSAMLKFIRENQPK